MVRMSDLVRGGTSAARPSKTEPPPPEEPRRPPTAAPPAAPLPSSPAAARLRMASLSGEMRAADAARVPASAEAPTASEADAVMDPADRILEDLGRFLERVRDLLKTSDPFPWADLEQLVERAVQSLEAGGDLFWLAHNPNPPEGADYLAFHQARVAVLAVRIGMTLGYDRRRLVELGMAAALIDIGLWQLPSGVLRRLDSASPDEQALYHTHPHVAAERLRRWGPPFEALAEIVLQHHELEQGQGFPQGIQGTSVRTEAKIIGLADTYTGLTGPPSLGLGLSPHEAIRDIVRSKHEAFPSVLIKALLGEISIFPPGTVVRLNTGEVGRVIAVNRNHPLRPRLKIVDSKHGPLTTPKIVDLSEAPFLYITGPVSETAR